MTERPISEYDRVAYPAYTHPQTHPDRLAVIGELFGLEPAPVTQSRVLELGCGDGTNLLPMAWMFPQSQFVGVDSAATPIQRGEQIRRDLGLGNLRLVHADLRQIGKEHGLFDYVIAHGLYSWVPREIREHLLAICRSLLRPNGIAFISYNAMPGFHLRNMLREMMQFHIRGFASADERVRQATALVSFLAKAHIARDEYGSWLRSECERVLEHAEGHLYHDDLAAINEAFYFSEFMEAVSQHGLQYLGEADFFEMSDHAFEDSTREILSQLAQNRLAKEQYLDFLKCRRFRQTLICQSEASLQTQPQPGKISRFMISSAATCKLGSPDLNPGVNCVFEGPKGGKCQTDLALGKAALVVLQETWPMPLPFKALLSQSQDRLAQSGIPVESTADAGECLRGLLLRLYAGGVVEFHTFLPPVARQVGDRPLAHPLARCQAAHGQFVTSLFHLGVKIEDQIGRTLLTWLDGTVERKELLDRLWAFLRARDLIQLPGGDELAARGELKEKLDAKLQQLARLGLLADPAAVPERELSI